MHADAHIHALVAEEVVDRVTGLAPTADNAPASQSRRRLDPAVYLRLQRTVGNAAAARSLATRRPPGAEEREVSTMGSWATSVKPKGVSQSVPAGDYSPRIAISLLGIRLAAEPHTSTSTQASAAIQRNNGRPRSYSAPPRLGEGEVKPAQLYFYCTEGDYKAILLHKAIWISGGAEEPGPSHGSFPVGPYATSVGPHAVGSNKEAFRKQFYGEYAVALTHYVAFRLKPGWEAKGLNIMDAKSPARFAWHWVGPTEPTDWIVRPGKPSVIRDAVSVSIVAHGPIP